MKKIAYRVADGDKSNIFRKFSGNNGQKNILLQSRQKWTRQRRNLAVGDVVLVSAENSPRNSWPLGRIVEVLPDRKSLVRRARVKVKSTILERPIDKLCLPLEA